MFPAQSRRTTGKPTQFILLPISSIESEDKNVGNFSAKIQKIGALGREVVESSNLKNTISSQKEINNDENSCSSIPGPSDKRPQGEEPKKTLIQATNPAPYSNTKSKKKSTVNLPREKSRRRKIQVLLSLLQDCRNLRINLAKKSIRLSSGRAEVSLVNLLRKLSSPKSDFDKSLKPFIEALLQDYSKEQLSNLFLNPSAITFLNTKDSSL